MKHSRKEEPKRAKEKKKWEKRKRKEEEKKDKEKSQKMQRKAMALLHDQEKAGKSLGGLPPPEKDS